MKKGMICRTGKKYSIVMTEDMKMEKIRTKEKTETGSKVFYSEKDVYRNKKFLDRGWMKVAAAFVIMAMVFGVVLVSMNNVEAAPYAIISVDINPSIEIEVDKKDKVLSVTALNVEAEAIINDEMIGKDLEEVMEEILAAAEEQEFLVEDDTILITETLINPKSKGKGPNGGGDEDDEDIDDDEDEGESRQLEEFMEKKQDQYNFLFYKGTEDEQRAAKSKGLSLGKYTMLRLMDGEVTKEQVKDMKMSEIAEMKQFKESVRLERKEGRTEIIEDEEEDNNPGNGKGQGQGQGKGQGQENRGSDEEDADTQDAGSGSNEGEDDGEGEDGEGEGGPQNSNQGGTGGQGSGNGKGAN